MVPTVFDADSKSLGQIAKESRALAERVRAGAITPPELSSGTFTVSNLGMFGIQSFVAVINPLTYMVDALRELMIVNGPSAAPLWLDFGVLGLPTQDPEGRTTVPTPIVARVKVPPGLIFQIAQAIADNVDKYERTYGAITPRPPEAGPPATDS